jgi:hypothetical protein
MAARFSATALGDNPAAFSHMAARTLWDVRKGVIPREELERYVPLSAAPMPLTSSLMRTEYHALSTWTRLKSSSSC